MPACVLVVDDDPDIREAVAEAVSDAGFTVAQAENGAIALDLMRASRPCIVLLDLMMPVMDGWQVCAEMRRDPALADVPVCIVSAHDRDLPRAACVLRKPVALATLIARIEEHCARS